MTAIIQQLKSISGLKIECPRCSSDFSVKRATLFSMHERYPPAAQKIIRERLELAYASKDELEARRHRLVENQKKKPTKISVSTEATNFGQISERIIPAFRDFPYKQDECRPIFKPIDYIVFSGLSQRNRVEAIKFVEFKTGGGYLNPRQRQIRDRVSAGKIRHKVIEL